MEPARLYEVLERIGNLLRAEERRLGGDLPPVQLHALAYLDRCNRYSDTPAAVTEYLGVTKGTASQSLKKLRERGFVSATTDPEDARVQHLAVTARGKKRLAQALPASLVAEAMSAVADPGALAAGLAELLVGLQRANGGRSFGVCRTCRHFRQDSGTEAQCGLTGEALSIVDAASLCREHDAGS